MKPILACDFVLTKVVYPIMLFPKIDGVRGLNVLNQLVGRSGKRFANKLNTEFYSRPCFNGFDGEMVVRRITGDGICNETTSALSTIKGLVPTKWCLFDYVVDGYNNHKPYKERLAELERKVAELYIEQPELSNSIWVIPHIVAHNQEELEDFNSEMVSMGYEGIIGRDPEGTYKYGRATVKEGSYLRLKGFVDAEIEITHVLEGMSNQNEAVIGPHGYTERSTLAENMVPNGMVGTVCGKALEDIVFNKRTIIHKGDEIEVAAGKLTHDERKFYFENQAEIIGKIGKYKFFPVGVKDKPRFPTFQCFRDPVDM